MATQAATPSPRALRTSNPPAVRRSVTLPINLAESRNRHAIPQDDSNPVEVLFSHPSGRIVAFSPSIVDTRSISGSGRRSAELDTDAAGTLPWASRTERTLASGPFRIHRAHGVAFLYAGQITHPILAKSQCWCVDGETKFALRIRDNSYYRIELPNEAEEDRRCAESFKEVLTGVLQYEKTACPFKRGFTVDLPEPPKTPIKKKPWKAPERPTSQDPKQDEEVSSTNMHAKAHPNYSNKNGVDGSDGDAIDDMDATPTREVSWETKGTSVDAAKTPTRRNPLAGTRSVTEPPLTIQTIYRSAAPGFPNSLDDTPTGSPSRSSSVDSFHSFHSPISPLLPSSPSSNASSPTLSSETLQTDLGLPQPRSHRREISELTITPEKSMIHDASTPTYFGEERSSSLPSTPPTLMSDTDDHNEPECSEIITPPQQTTGLRKQRGPTHRRSLSPLPPAANLVFPSSRSQGHHLTTAIIQRTCSVMIGTPLHIISLMLNMAQRIRGGRLDGIFFGYGEGGERIPCQWDSSDSEDPVDKDDDDWGEDDYGISLRGIRRRRGVLREESGGSWEID
ncbi:MAG: hypothetical protein M1837_004887 [Sclerophora amabilis]|nr:MAG: hypothetical protein M1837_004887 [Sclerophora amabilis]